MQELGYSILSTGGTGKHLKANGVDCEIVLKIQEGRPNIGDLVKNGDIAMMLITSTGDLSTLYECITHDVLVIKETMKQSASVCTRQKCRLARNDVGEQCLLADMTRGVLQVKFCD